MLAGLRPLELHNHREQRRLEITWSDGVIAKLSHRLLREACRCAHCLSLARTVKEIRAASGVRLDAVEAYGANCLHLVFDDGHGRGLYPFEYLRELAAGDPAAPEDQQENELAKPSSNSGLR